MTPYELLFDLWPFVSRAAGRAADRGALTRALRFADLAARSEDPQLCLAAAATFADAATDDDGAADAAAELLSRAALRTVLLPAVRLLAGAPAEAALLARCRATHGGGLRAARAPPPELGRRLAKLAALRAVHPAVPPSVLAYAEDEYAPAGDAGGSGGGASGSGSDGDSGGE